MESIERIGGQGFPSIVAGASLLAFIGTHPPPVTRHSER